MHQGFKVSVLRYQPNYLVIYDQKFDWPSRTPLQIENQKNLSRGVYNGYMSPKTKSKVRKYLSTWVSAVEALRESKQANKTAKKPYLTFVTLTLPSAQIHEDNEIKRKCLIPFIQELGRKYDVWNYFWRAEAQKNGNIHFHLIIDSYIDAITLRGVWNRHINRLDYVDNFRALHGHDNPNSTDIHSLREVNNAGAYLIKYVSKSDGYREIDGRIHGCSDRVRVLTPYEIEIDSMASDCIKEALASPKSKVVEGETYKVIIFQSQHTFSPSFKKLKLEVRKYLVAIGIDLYNNREASLAEVEEAEFLKAVEERDCLGVQMGLPFDYTMEAAFHNSEHF